MNASRLQHIIQNPDSIDAQTSMELQAIASDLPWFSTPRTLLARYYKSKNDYRETDSLHHAALRIQDRRWLYHYLNQAPTASVSSSQKITHQQPTATPTAVEEKIEPTAEPIEASSKPHFEPVGSSPTGEMDIHSDSAQPLSEDHVALVEAAVPSGLSFAPAEPEADTSTESPNITYDVEDQFESETPRPEPLDFFSWLKQAQGEEESPSPVVAETPLDPPVAQEIAEAPVESDIQNLGTTEVPDYNLDHLTLREENEPEEPKFLDLAARQALIDKFIATNPSVSRPKKEFYNPEVAMKRAEEFDASFCSETLAALFRKQQAWGKALACYSRLQLKFPEKSAYFAALITEVENEKRNHES
ncbi:MAG: hypothetical protein O3C22_05345 [Bacteroidetes bacterium]|nr:hypothetical protein [Bacteroidota bacterium]MDA0943536.1 hypothetical protein [Bacteroidota bacterium]